VYPASIRRPVGAVCLLALLLAAPALGGGLDAAERARLVLDVAGLVEQEYVFPDTAARAGAGLRELAASGAEQAPAAPADFAAWLSGHLLRLTADKHVRVRLQGAVSDVPDSSCGWRGAEVLAGGIGYLRIDRFHRAEDCRAQYERALATVAGCRAVIVDLTRNGGGSDANMLLASYFLPESTLLNRIEWRRGEPLEFRAGPSPLPQLARARLFILVGGETFSAAEAVAYALQQCGRAVIVGETTRGGANPNRFFPLDHGLEVSVSIGRTINAASGGNWEGVGVAPDVAVPADQALAKALELAGAP
jgi:C-terminal processing protease CtpA/Prc